MKKIIPVFLLLLLIIPEYSVYAYKNEKIYTDYLIESKKYEYDNFNIQKDIYNLKDFYDKILNSVKKSIIGVSGNYLKIILLLFVICTTTSISNSLITSKSIADIINNISVIICAVTLLPFLKQVLDLGISVIHNITQYMNFSFPGISVLLSSSGYNSTAYSLNVIYTVFSNIISLISDKLLMPILYSLIILVMANAVYCSPEFNNLIKHIIKLVKYIIGIILTIFSAFLTISGFASSAGDTLVIKTAKYAIANFVPIVGNCLSETLNNVLYSSSILKNTLGYIGIITIIMISIIPIIKLFLSSIFIKALSIIASIVQNEKINDILMTLSEIYSMIAAIALFLSVSFMVLLGVVASIGG